jgi:ketosteroid isomerase-like protein
MPSPDPAAVVTEVNRIWRTNAPAQIAPAIAPYFTDDAVFVAPDLARVAAGRDAVASSYADFIRHTTLIAVHVEDPQVDSFGDVAVATMPWSMRYDLAGELHDERGYDTYVLRRDEGAWRICWRAMTSSAQA